MSEILIDKELLLEILKEMEFLVVSLDRIGSDELSENERAEILYRFFVEGDVFRRLAFVRRNLTLAVDASLSVAERDGFEKMLGEIVFWMREP